MNWKFSLVGLIIGFLIGLTGMGGGSLMTPVMVLVMGVKPVIAVGTDLAYGAITKILGGAIHARQQTVHRKTAYLLAAGSVPATIFGVSVTSALKAAYPDLVNVFLLRAIAVVLIFVALVLFLRPWLEHRLTAWNRRRGSVHDQIAMLGERRPWALPILGAVVGFMVGLTSVGSGTLIILGLFLLYPRWESKELVGTDVFHAAILVSAAALAQFSAGNVNLSMMLSLLVGSIPGVLIGSRLVISVPGNALRMTLAGVLLISGAKML